MSQPAPDPAAGPDLTTTRTSARKLGKYELRGELGKGTYGVVWKGFDPFVQRDVAIKVAREGHAPASGEGTLARNESAAFFAEARAAGRLHHPYVVLLYDAGIESGQHYIVMEYIEGETLRRHCARDAARMPLERVLDIMLKCSLALDYVHKNGVLHKDIKPGNIMLARDGAPKIMDFGIAALGTAPREAAPDESQVMVMGSPMYMPPEQIRGKELGPPTDLYALGTIMYQLLAGVPPFWAPETKQLFHQIKYTLPKSLRELRPDLPEPLYKVVDRLLIKDPAGRYQTGKDLAEDLGPLCEHNKRGTRRKSLVISHDSLKHLHFFKAFKSRELGELMDASQTVTFKAGESIIKEGETDNALYILLAGIGEVRKNGQLIAVMEKGDCFGEIGFLYAVKRTASVVAATDVLVLKVNSALLDQMSDDVQLRYYKIFCENLIIRLTLTTEKAARMLPKNDVALDFILP